MSCAAFVPSNYKQLLDEVYVISRIIEIEVGVISRSRRLRLITLTETSIILNITKTKSNNFFYYTLNGKNWGNFFCFFANAKQHKARELDMITLRNHAPRSYMTWLPVALTWLLVTLTWLLYNLQVLTSRAPTSKIHCRLSVNQKRVRELNV